MKKKKRKPAHWIYGELTKKQVKLGDLASGLGVTSRSVYYVIQGKHRTRRIQEAVAAALGRSFESVWGIEKKETGKRGHGEVGKKHRLESLCHRKGGRYGRNGSGSQGGGG